MLRSKGHLSNLTAFRPWPDARILVFFTQTNYGHYPRAPVRIEYPTCLVSDAEMMPSRSAIRFPLIWSPLPRLLSGIIVWNRRISQIKVLCISNSIPFSPTNGIFGEFIPHIRSPNTGHVILSTSSFEPSCSRCASVSWFPRRSFFSVKTTNRD